MHISFGVPSCNSWSRPGLGRLSGHALRVAPRVRGQYGRVEARGTSRMSHCKYTRGSDEGGRGTDKVMRVRAWRCWTSLDSGGRFVGAAAPRV